MILNSYLCSFNTFADDSGSLGRSVPYRDSDISMTDADDEILESLVKTATAPPVYRTTPRERKRARQADRKSCMFISLFSS